MRADKQGLNYIRRFRIAFCLAAAMALARLYAQESAAAPSAVSYKAMSLAQLMDQDVTSVSKEPEPYLQAPAAIDVITSDEIRRSGASSLPEALRLADNLDIAQQNASNWAISSRGFNANLANKLLVLIDGRAVYTPLYGGVLWNVQDTVLEDIDRVEVISGPGGTLWGANAVNGVINVTTKSAKDTQGLYLEEAGGGTRLRDQTEVRYGTTAAPGVYMRVYGQYTDHGPEVLPSGAGAADSWNMARGGFRVDSEAVPQTALTLQGDIYDGSEYLGAVGVARQSGGNLLGRWSHSASDGSNMTLQLYYDRTHLSQPFAASPANPPYYSGFPAAALTDNLDTYDVDFQDHLQRGGRQELVWGLGYRFTHEVDNDLSVVRFSPPILNLNLYSGFVQDEIALCENLRLTLGTKLEHNDYTGFELEPSARLQWNLTPRQTLWAAVSRAVRTPSRYDRALEVPTGLVHPPGLYQFPADYLKGSANFTSETVIAYELGYRAQIGEKVSASVSAFYNSYNNLRSTTATPTTALYIFPYPVYFQNNLEGETHGIELSSTYQALPWWRFHAGYDLLEENIHARSGRTDATGGLNETADPRHQFSLRSDVDLLKTVELDAALRWVGALTVNSGPTSGPVAGTVPSYYELDARVAWHPTDRLELSLIGQNLLHDHHQEYGFPGPTTEEIARSVYGKLAWRY